MSEPLDKEAEISLLIKDSVRELAYCFDDECEAFFTNTEKILLEYHFTIFKDKLLRLLNRCPPVKT